MSKTPLHVWLKLGIGSTRAETTITPTQNHVCCERPSLENIEGVVLNSSFASTGDVVIRRRKPLMQGVSSESVNFSRTVPSSDMAYPQSADLLERNRRSHSEER